MNTTTTVNPSLDADDRKQLIDSVRRFAERDYGFEARMRALRLPGGFSPDHWRTFAELGWLGIGLPDACGGIGGAIEQALLAEELGRCLVVEPWLTNCALAGPLLAAQGSDSQRDLVARMVSGDTQLALAAFERQG
ncbi:MAG TPA: acyl-CoA dehydrogenase family protein, partial [Burkholderiaceae bacterium]|nr:acyl-CoA dehydrogenase family protein [Burkholderiaceae bacterium]